MSVISDNLARRLRTEGKRFLQRVGNVGALLPNFRSSKRKDIQSRYAVSEYEVREWMLAGTVYHRGRHRYGNLDHILRSLGKPCGADAPPIIGYYNPVPSIVGCYANALGGTLGNDLELVTPDGDALPKAVTDAVSRVWRWSGLDGGLNEFTELLANQGTVGIRIASVEGKVYLKFDPPEIISDFEEDARGNTVWVNLKYTGYEYDDAGIEKQVQVDAFFSRDTISVRVTGGRSELPVERVPTDDQVNDLGVCPYRVARHQKRAGNKWGIHAYEGSELPIHGINWGLSQLDEAVARAINETVFMAGAGEAPTQVNLGRLTAMYVKLANGVPSPELQYIVPQLKLSEAGEYIARNIELLWTRQPELILNALKLLSGVSGETLAQVLKPVEAAVKRARTNYEANVVAAMQIALSVGVVNGLWNLGTGIGTKDAADRAYDDGQGVEAMVFKSRPLLPPTPQGQLVDVQVGTADQLAKFTLATTARGVIGDPEELLRLAGYDKKDIKRLAGSVPPPAPAGGAAGDAADVGTQATNNLRLSSLLSRLK